MILALPYDRPNTTMKAWPLDAYCDAEYHDPANRRFHAQPVACPDCGPHHQLHANGEPTHSDDEAHRRGAELLREGKIVAVKGLGGYHLSCDARNAAAVSALRERKYPQGETVRGDGSEMWKARVLGRIVAGSRGAAHLTARGRSFSPRPGSSCRMSRRTSDELGVMLPYTPLHHLLFAAGAPDVLVMTSANRSSEPIAYEDEDAFERLSGVADAFLVGERPIARRVDDSVVARRRLRTVDSARDRADTPRARWRRCRSRGRCWRWAPI